MEFSKIVQCYRIVDCSDMVQLQLHGLRHIMSIGLKTTLPGVEYPKRILATVVLHFTHCSEYGEHMHRKPTMMRIMLFLFVLMFSNHLTKSFCVYFLWLTSLHQRESVGHTVCCSFRSGCFCNIDAVSLRKMNERGNFGSEFYSVRDIQSSMGEINCNFPRTMRIYTLFSST